MRLFHRKHDIPEIDVPEISIPEVKHTHTWKDMPWYMEVEYNGTHNTASYKIIEPYICITCGERQDKVLEKCSWTNIGREERDKEFSYVKKKYKKFLRPRAIIEDMINNILMVKDPDHLHMVETMRGTPHQGCGTSSEMFKYEEEKAPRIEMEEEHD